MLSDLQLVYMVPRNSTQLININTTKFQVERKPVYCLRRQSLLSLHMTKSYVRTATRSTLKVEANLTQILNFKANFHTEFEPFFKKKKFMLTMVDTLRLSA